MKKRRKLINHIEHCQWSIKNVYQYNQKWYAKKKSYYFRKQIEVAEKLLKTLK
jgi:hypothetical protein